MLNIGRMAPGGEGYYLATVAKGVEDYYLGRGEAAGSWIGAASRELDLSGGVDGDDLSAVLEGLAPDSRDPLLRQRQRKVPGFDLTFRAPKSVSLLYGLGDSAVSREVSRAHDAAVEAALGYVEREALRTRRGRGGAERVRTTGTVAAAFRHRTSRAGDPLLHTHILVANLAQAEDDGLWRTLDSRRLYAHAKTAGCLYQAHLRHELTMRLGVAWEPVSNGLADIAGVPREVIEAFSQRRAEILAALEERGESSAKAAQIATLDTRTAKDHDVDAVGLRERWRRQADGLGFDPATIPRLLHREAPGLDEAYVAEVAEDLVGPEGLTAQASTFTRRDAIQAWCERLPVGATVEDAERLADALLDPTGSAVVRLDDPHGQVATLTSRDVIRRKDGTIIPAVSDEARYSTPELLALEQQVVDSAVGRRAAGVAAVDAKSVDIALRRRPSISDEQAEMVRRLTTSGAGVEAVIGKAGAGKTFALDAAREAWHSEGNRVVGAALAARAALELESGAGVDSYTLDRLLADLDHPEHGGFAPHTVLLVDEAGMAGTRKLARLLDHAERADAKVVLVGDPNQLPEIDTGGVLRGLANRLPVIELTENRRQTAEWERDALDELRTGDIRAALDAYRHNERLVLAETAEAAREQLVGDWWHAHSELGMTGVMIAARRSDVADLNEHARLRLTEVGELSGPELHVADRRFRTGDRVVCLRNNRRLDVVNGTRGTVLAVDVAQGDVVLQRDDADGIVTLPSAYLEAGHLDHAYAVTAHKAQGLTCDATWVLGSDAVYREWGYVALSRGRHSNRLYVVGDEADLDALATNHGGTDLVKGRDPVRELARDLARSRSKHLAVDQTDGRFREMSSKELADAHRQLRQRLHEAVRQGGVEELGRLKERRSELEEQRRLLQARSLGEPVPIGLFRRMSSRQSTPSPRDAAALDLCGRQIEELDRRITELERRGSGVGIAPERVARDLLEVDGEMCVRASSAARAAEFDPPAYVAETLGRRPTAPEDRAAWRTAVRAIESYRTRWGVDDPLRPLGERPRELVARREHDELFTDLLQIRRRLLDEPAHGRELDPSVAERALTREL